MKTFTTYAEKKAKQFLNLLQGYTKGIRFTAILILLLMGVNNAWAGAGFYEVYFTYSYNNQNKVQTDNNENSKETSLGVLTADFKITSMYLKYWKDGSGNMCGGLVEYYIDSDKEYQPNWDWVFKEGHNHELQSNTSWTIAQHNGNSGKYTFWYRFKTWGSSNSSDGCSTSYYVPTDGSSKNCFTYTINPPAVNNFTVTPSGNKLSGSGTQNDPYIIKYNGSLTLTLSGSPNHTDANSTIQYNTAGAWNTKNSRTISNITSTDVKNVTVKARYTNNTDANLSGAESSKKIYYRSENRYTVTFNANGHGTAPAAQTINHGSKASEPTAPIADGYIFGGWYTDQECNTVFDFNREITGNITLYAKWTEITVSARLEPNTVQVGTTNLTFSITSNVPLNSGYYVAVYNFGNDNHANGYLSGDKPYDAELTKYTCTYAQNTPGTYYTRAVVIKDSRIQAISEKIAITVGEGGNTPDPAELVWTMNTRTRELGRFEKVADEDTYKLTITVPENNDWGDLQYRNNANFAGATGAVPLIRGEQQLVNIGGWCPWQDGAGTFTITIQKEGGNWMISAEEQVVATKTIYFRPTTEWKNNNPVIICDDESTAVTPYDCDGEYYTAEVPGGTTNLQFGGNREQTLSLTVPTDDNVLYDMTSENITKLYLKANSAWKADGARFAAYFFGNGERWISMTAVAGQTDLYEVVIPTDKSYPSVIFCRMNPSAAANNWQNKWNQTEDLTIPTDGTNTVQLPVSIQHGVIWHTTWDDSRWEEFTAPTYSITLNQSDGGTISVSKSSNIALNEQVTVTFTPNLGYKLQSANITGVKEDNATTAGTYTICGPTEITAEFVKRDLYVNPSWGWDGAWHFPMTQLDNKVVYTYNTLSSKPSIVAGLGAGKHSFKFRESDRNTVAYDYDDVQKPTGTYANGELAVTALDPGAADNNIAFTLKRKSDVTITLTLQNGDKPTVNIEAIPYYNITLNQANATSQSNPTSVEVKWNGEMPELTTTPTRTGYTFGGYYANLSNESSKYYNADGTSAKAWDIDTNEDNIILHAKWTAIPYEITYELNGGTNDANNPEQYDISQEVTLQTPTKANCYFVGWYTNSDLTGDPVTTISKGSIGAKKFYAKWASLTITSSPEYLIPSQRLQLGIDYENIPEGYYYVVKVSNKPYNNNINGESKQTSPISGTGSTTYTAFGHIDPGTYTVVVGLYRKDINWNVPDAIPLASATITIIVENQHGVGVFSYTNDVGAQDGGIVNTNNVLASEHVGAEVVATPNPGYRFDQWKYIPGHGYENKITFTDAKASTTTIYATAGGQIYANFVARGLYVNPSWGEWLREWFLPMTQSNNKLSYSYNTLSSKPSAIAGLDAGEHNFNIREENEDLAYNFDDVKIEHSGEITDVTSHNPQDPNSNIKFTLSNRSEVTITLELANEGKPTVRLHADRYYTINYKTGYGENTTCLEGWLKSTDNIKIAYAITRPGYTFTGWNSEIDGTGEAPDDSKQMGEQDRTYYAQWTPATYTVTLDNEGGSGVESVQATYGSAMPTITIPTRTDHLFMGYYDGDDGTGTQYYNADGTSAKNWDKTDNTTLHAKWLNASDCIFFYNNLGWRNVYVYFYSSDKYWDDSKGTGSKNDQTFPQDGDADHKPHYLGYRGQMTKIEGTNIWYYNRSVHSEIKRDNYSCVAFTKDDQREDYEWFWKTEVVRRGDYNSNLPMFVSMKADKVTKNESSYYNYGYWMNYPTNTGYKLHIFDKDGNKINDQLVDIPFEYGDNMIMPWSVNVSLEEAKTYAFKIQRVDGTNEGNGTWYGNNGKMTTNSSGDVGQTAWEFTTGTDNCKITTTAPGTYVFTLKYDKDAHSNYNYLVGVEYPASEGDYRLAYKDNAHPFHPGHLLKKRDGKDTVSFFVHYNESPVIMLQKVTKIDANTGAITWTTKKTYALTANQAGSEHPGQSMMPGRRNAGADEVILHIGGEHLENVDATGVYNFILEQTSGEATLQGSATKYDGNFYIRTNAAAGGWGDFRQAGNKMTYSSYAERESHSDFNHYFVEWVETETGGNVKFTIANDYSYCISDTLDADNIIQKNGVSPGCLPADANVRFGWDSRNNKLTRAYIAGSGNVWDRFLVVTGNNLLKDAEGKTLDAGSQGDTDKDKEDPRCKLNANEDIFKDLGNWVYQVDVTAQNGTMINLTALYNGTIQYFKGAEGEPSYPLLASTNVGKEYKIRMIYNFKTNHLVVAWLPDSPYNANGDEYLGTDMLLIRRNQEPATQLKLNSIEEKDTISGIKTAYAVMTFTKTFVEDDEKPIHERKHYWVSFPFDVKISDVFGFSEYKDHWIMQAYDGAGRAANGLWADTDTYWKYITNANYVMRKGQGYVLTLDVKKMLELDPVFANTGEVSLYFPSRGKLDTITSYVPTAATVPAHTCTIERENRKIYDSHWNLIGVPGFADIANFNTDAPDKYLQESELEYQGDSLSFYYAYIPAENSYKVQTGDTTFQSMYSYMVQFAGTINWSSKEVTYNGQQQLAARRNSEGEYPEKVSFRLELAQGDKMADQTFVQLQEEGATTEFDMNLDLTKIINSGANIYTLVGNSRIQTAGNALPMDEAVVVPVGVKIDAEGEYTFRMPDGTEGMVVELVDYETYNRTNLLLTDYTVTLPKGTNEYRFALHIQPQKDVVTSLENIGEGVNNDEAVKKYLIDGKLIIRTADGVVYDAQGKRL